MRTGLPAGLDTVEAGRVLRPRYAITAWNELLSFPAPSSASVGSLDTDVPQSYLLNTAGTHVYAAFRLTDGSSRVVALSPATASEWGLQQTSATIAPSSTIHCMRPGLATIGGTSYVYSAIASGSQVQVRRAALSGTSNPLTLSFSNYGPVFGPALVDSSPVVRRVEAVCPTANGVVVAIGTHRFDDATYPGLLSTIEFFFLPDSSRAIQLNPILQAPVTETYTNWYSVAKWATRIAAVATSSGVQVVANASPDGRAVQFSIRGGIEGELEPVVHTDIEHVGVYFEPASLSSIGGLYYLAGRATRKALLDGEPQTTGELVYDCHLTSADAERWSVGERSHFIFQPGGARGTLLLIGDQVYYGGNGYSTHVLATPTQKSDVTGQSVDLSDRARGGFQLSFISNGADTLQQLGIANADDAYTDHAVLRNGSALRLRTGQGTDLGDIAVFGVDSAQDAVTPAGVGQVVVAGRDLGGKKLVDWRANVEMTLRGRLRAAPALDDLAGLVQKTADRGTDGLIPQLTVDPTDKLVFRGLNDPAVLFLETAERDSGDGLTRSTVRFGVDDDYHLSMFGVLIGANDDGTGNVLLVPKGTGWQQTKARMRRLSLTAVDPAKPDEENTGWNLKARTNPLWVNVGTGGTVRTAEVTGTYRTDTAPGLAADTDYDLAVRVAGRRVQMFAKERDMSPANCATKALWTLYSEFLFGDQAKRMPNGKRSSGIALATDVFLDTTAFAHAVYDDVELALSSATDNRTSTAAVADAFSGVFSVSSFGSQDFVTAVSGFNMSQFAAGQHVRVRCNTLGSDGFFTVGTVVTTPGSEGFYIVEAPHGFGSDSNCTVYIRSDEGYGYVASGVRDYTEFGGAKRVQDPRAIKTLLLLYGAGIIVSNDNTALSRRLWESDGVIHRMVDDDFDTTWPGGSGTDPSVWRLVFHHNAICRYWVSETHGLGATGHFLIDDEVVGYEEVSFTRFRENKANPYAVTAKWTVIPTYYTVVAEQSAISQDIYNIWLSGHAVGEGFDSAVIVAGMLAEITARNSEEGFRLPETEAPPQWYVKSKAGSGETASIKAGTYDEPFGTLGDFTPDVLVRNAEIAVCSARGKWGTTKSGHDPSAPVAYYPCNSSGACASITVSRLLHMGGRYQSTQDMLGRLCALAGLRSATFRNAFATPTTAITRAITTTPYTLPLREDMSNFVLDLSAHLPESSVARLLIGFRSYYQLVLQWKNTPAQIQAGYLGNLRVGLLTTSTDISADGGGDRWLEYVDVPVSDYCASGAYSGSYPSYTFTSNAAANMAIRLTVRDNLVAVELNGQPAWTFDLDALQHASESGVTSYRRDTAGPVTVAYSATISGNSATILVQELGAEADDALVVRGDSARSIIDRSTAGQHIRDISTQDGGRLFSQFWVRDDAGTLIKNLLRHQWSHVDHQRASHQQVTGRASGEAVDEASIRADGYQFGTDDNDLMQTVQQCVDEARLVLREQAEYIQEDQLSGHWVIRLQPEDKIALDYGPAGGIPEHSVTDHVVTAISVNAGQAAAKAEYTLRRYEGVPA